MDTQEPGRRVTVRILNCDVMDGLRQLPDESVHLCVTSPPYFGLRSYLKADHPLKPFEIGQEATPEEFIAKLVAVFREVRRVLRNDGTLWVNIGDSYANDSKWGGASGGKHVSALHGDTGIGRGRKATGLKSKDLIGIPWMLAFALRADGWYLRRDIIWNKPSCMPESVKDRCTTSHEYIFHFAKSAAYFYDNEAIKEPFATDPRENYPARAHITGRGSQGFAGARGNDRDKSGGFPAEGGRNKRSVWSIASQPFSGAHYAVFPPELPETIIKAGTSEKGCCAKCGTQWERQVERGDVPMTARRSVLAAAERQGHPDYLNAVRPSSLGAGSGGDVPSRIVTTIGWKPTCECGVAETVPATVLDCFGGAGTTGLVADRLQRNAILIDLYPANAPMMEERISRDAPLFAQVGT